MRKIIKVMIIGLGLLFMTACGSNEAQLEEIFEKTITASNELNSFSANMKIGQTMSASTGESIDMVISTDMDMIQEPLSLYQKMDMELAGMGGQLTTESYLTEDGFFMHDGFTNQWIKMPGDMYSDFVQISEQQTDPGAQLEQFKQFVEDFKFEEDGSTYILSLEASGEKFEDIIKELSLDMLGEEMLGAGLDELFGGLTIDKLNYTIHVDKSNYFPKKVEMNMDMAMEMEGEKLTISQSMNGTYSNFNGIEKIEVPQDVLDNAKEGL